MLAKTETALASAFAKAYQKSEHAPNATAIQSVRGFVDDNCKAVTALQPTPLLNKATFTMDDGTEVPIRYEYHRPSDFIANIATVANPGLGYQRRPQERLHKLRPLANTFKPVLLGLFHAWINDDGLPELLDGLGRSFVCLHMITQPYNKPVLVAIHLDVLCRDQAAIRFLELNPDTVTKVSHKNKFLARLSSGEGLAAEVSEQAEIGKLIVGGGGRNGISVQSAEALQQLGVLSTVGLLKANGEWHDKLSNPYFVGLGAYLVATGDNSTTMRDFMKSTSIQAVEKALHRKYDASTPHGRATAARFAFTLVELRNYNRKSNEKRVVPNWDRVDALMKEAPFSDRWHVGFRHDGNPKVKPRNR